MKAKAKRRLGENVIGAPSIRVARGEVDVEDRVETDPATGRVTGSRTGHVAGLRRYLARGEITRRQFAGGQAFCDTWERCSQAGVRAQDIVGMSGGGSRSSGDRIVSRLQGAEIAVAAARKLQRAIVALGPCYSIVADVVLAMGSPQAWASRKGYPRDYGFAVFVVGLDALADVFEID
jgi:hypothetical protein